MADRYPAQHPLFKDASVEVASLNVIAHLDLFDRHIPVIGITLLSAVHAEL